MILSNHGFPITVFLDLKSHESFTMIMLSTLSRYHRQKQPPRGVLSKRCSENMMQIYGRTPMPKCDFNKVAKQSNATLLKSHCGMGVLL